MSELCCSKGHFSSLLISYIIHLCSFILSHPLYFAYFIFFSPHILKLVYFLSPLLITISLLLLAFVVNEDFSTELSACASVLEGLRFKKHCPNEEEFRGSDDLGMYEILFGPSVIMEVGENPVESSEENPEEDPPLVGSSDNEEIKEEDLSTGGEKIESFAANKVVINPVPPAKTASSNCGAGLMEERRLKNFLKILDEFEKMASGVDERKKVVELPPKSPLRNRSETMETKMSADNKVGVNNSGKDHHRSTARAHSQRISSNVDHHADEDDAEYKKIATSVEEKRIVEPPPISAEVLEKSPTRNGSGANDSKTSVGSSTDSNGGKDHHKSMVKAHSQRIGSNVYHRGDEDDNAEHKAPKNHNSLGNYGSMRKEKEWKRTLACKLFEERHNVDGGEGMDSLWEAYEVNSNNGTTKKTNKKKNENKNKSKKKSEIEEEDDDYEEGGINGQLCCLQALNLSTKKMNLGIGRPNLVKISKAIKGIGWLHHVSKKVHSHGDRY